MNILKSLLKKNNQLLAFIFFMVGANLFSCSTKQKAVQNVADASVLIVATMGEQIIELQNAQYKAIMKAVKETDFNNLKKSYKGKLRDLPLTSITYKGHKVTYQQAACPDKLQVLASLLEEFHMEN